MRERIEHLLSEVQKVAVEAETWGFTEQAEDLEEAAELLQGVLADFSNV